MDTIHNDSKLECKHISLHVIFHNRVLDNSDELVFKSDCKVKLFSASSDSNVGA
jgi:hypothetical protein